MRAGKHNLAGRFAWLTRRGMPALLAAVCLAGPAWSQAVSRPMPPLPQAAQHPHLDQWFQNHQNMSPEQREDALRREPGFRSLPEWQQQRLIDRLRTLASKTPEQRQRTIARNEMFERLSPERKQEVRGASQALSMLPLERQLAVRHAFQQLRRMPPDQRQLVLHSGSYMRVFTPQELTILGNILSIEPYQPVPGEIPQPYFGRQP
ncbi:DUF3106 domain-containing protein [Silvibacterium acidisoli]|uniref:DUF3106 domain-containing protein n=1 Tax=Acidobacteriaceae bacterium ZG23-2 TaxID=2883246 RepID=UPI00406C52FD